MVGARTRAEAERSALNGNNESQDSQAIFEIYAKQFGVGVTSSSPRSRRDIEDSGGDASTSPVVATASSTPGTSPIVNGPLAEPLVVNEPGEGSLAAAYAVQSRRRRQQDRSPVLSNIQEYRTIADSQPTVILPAEAIASRLELIDDNQSKADVSSAGYSTSTHDQADATWSDGRTIRSPPSFHDTRPIPGKPAQLRKRKMDLSQASPTQKNDDRDYQSHYDNLPSGDSPIPESPQPPCEAADQAERDRTHDGDTGLVHFGSLDFLGGQSESQRSDAEPSSPIDLEGPGLSNTRHGWKLRTSSSQQHSSLNRPEDDTPFKPTSFAPETPAQPRNPFAGNTRLGGQALAASQLFGNTQQLSSAIKAGFSPTSSRPSPNLHLYHHSISTNAVDSPLKIPYNITSPTVGPSSPAIPESRPRTSSSLPEHQTPAPARWQEDHGVEVTPQEATARPPRRFREPMGQYVSMKESQERRSSAEVPPIKDSFYDSDDALAAETRRKRVARRRDEAMRELAGVSFSRPGKHDTIEVPSTTQKDRPKQRAPTSPVKTLDLGVQSLDNNVEDDDDMSTVADSQEPVAPAGAATTEPALPRSPNRHPEMATGVTYDSSNERIPDSTGCTAADQEETHEAPGDEGRSADKIPDTSPFCMVRSTSTVEQSLRQTKEGIESENLPAPAAFVGDESEPQLPEPARRSGRILRPSSRARMILSDDTSSVVQKQTGSSDMPLENADEFKVRSDMSIIPESSPRQITQQVRGLPSSPPTNAAPVLEQVLESREPPSTPNEPPATALSASSSSLTQLSCTPEPPSEITPITEPSGGASRRRRQSGKPVLPHLKTALDDLRHSPGRSTRRTSRQSVRLGSASTDELAKSPSAVGFENSMIRQHKVGGKGGISSGPKHQTSGGKLFSDMAFAVSFQSKQPGESADAYEKRTALSSDIERQIIEAGGRLLSNGFDELFDSTALKAITTSPAIDEDREDRLGLASESRTLGFTALIADGHSRKAKYMQALALGLPCISDRWISACVAKKAIVDWSPYLLCAGQSTYLRGAVRSRLLAPYEAIEARLVDVIERRTKLLEGGKILLVMKKSRQEDKKMMYVFLTHVLGASLVRAHTVAEAQEMIRQRELLQDPFDWVYVDGNTGTDEELFGDGHAPTATASKKRKRSSSAAVTAAPARKKIRTLNDELVIQSLILGRMIEEGDLEG